ncbi:MAG: copper homeostasis protein CutC [Chitinophagaceae bacterium]|nr:copper homeostasis protein CutC [Chitinophagaceae bacterium]
MSTQYSLEVCAFNVQSCIIAERAGAVRAELCDNPVEGGTTPSYGCIRLAREKVNIQLYPIIRPRAGNYFYDEEEFEIMKMDIKVCKDLGCDGISIGVQLRNGEIDMKRFAEIMKLAYPMGVTSNRVFDAAPDPWKALEQLIELGCERVLTSGQKSGAPEAIDTLTKLVTQADERIIIMPGAGVRSSNIPSLLTTGAREFHTSARISSPDLVEHRNPEVLDFGNPVIADENELKRIVQLFPND